MFINFSCNLAGESVDLEYSLPDIVPGDHPNHIAEMRGLKLELHENKMSHVHFYSDGSHVESHGYIPKFFFIKNEQKLKVKTMNQQN